MHHRFLDEHINPHYMNQLGSGELGIYPFLLDLSLRLVRLIPIQ